MDTLITIDPGLREAGIARFEDGRLASCDAIYEKMGKGPVQWAAMAHALADWIDDVDTLAVEYMVTRRGREDAHDSLMQLSEVSGGVYALVQAAEMLAVSPGEWTRGANKKVQRRRVYKRLDDEETAVLEEGFARAYPANEKEIIAAVGIGLYVLKRW